MNRRDALAGLTTLALCTLAAPVLGREEGEHHHHEAGTSPYLAVQRSAAECVSVGQDCLAHCTRMLAAGDQSLGDCAAAVQQMLPLCSTLQALAAQRSPLTPALSRVVLTACEECAQACEPHADDHPECKACLQACQSCIRECKALA